MRWLAQLFSQELSPEDSHELSQEGSQQLFLWSSKPTMVRHFAVQLAQDSDV
jgi:hypothetical protein